MVHGPAARATSRSLIGRQEALARLDRALADAVEASRVGTVLVEGPAGIGKSRTVEEFRNAVQAAGGEVLVGRCVSLGEEIFPYAPIAELLRDLVARSGADAVRRWAGPAWPELARLVPALAPDDERTEGDSGQRQPPVPGVLRALRRDRRRAAAGARDRGPPLGRPFHPRAARSPRAPAARRDPARAHAAHRRGASRPRGGPAHRRAGAPYPRPGRARAAHPRRAGAPDQRHPRRAADPVTARPGLRPRRGEPLLRRGAAGAARRGRAPSDRA